MKRFAFPLFIALSTAGFIASVWWVFTATPMQFSLQPNGALESTSLFYNYKIFYHHVPHAFWLFGATFVAGICSIAYLKTRDPKWDDVAIAAVEVAAVFGAVVLVTGSIWARAAWGVWWNTEPRLTMSLLLWLILMGYVLVRRFAGPSADRIAAGMAIFGMVGVPFIYKMVGQDSHPSSGSDGVVARLGEGTRAPFWLSVAAFLCWFIALVIYRVQATRAERNLRELRERGLDMGVLS